MPLETLHDALENAAGIGDRGYVVAGAGDAEVFHSYAELVERARRRAGALRAVGLRPGDRVGLMCVGVLDFVVTFYGAVLAGVVPVPMFPPLALSRLDGFMQGAAAILERAGCGALIADRRLALLLWGLVDRVPALSRVLSVDAVERADTEGEHATRAAPDDLAFLQFTSGSTALPKGVQVTHRMVVQNVLASARDVVGARPDRDVGVSWLPLFHDMGLSFATVGLIMTTKMVFIPTLDFVRRPNLWLDAIHRHRGTVTYAPNFAYGLARRRARDEQLDRWDLSCVRVIGCGAEPIQAETLRAFQEQFGRRCGLPAEAFQPCYGLAEATLAVTMVPVDEPFRVDRVDAERLRRDGVAEVARAGDAQPLELVSCGPAITGHQVVVRAPDGSPVPPRVNGQVTVRGPCVTPGYYDDDEATREILRDGWLQTGDLGYLADGELYVTGREKDLVIIRGRNYHPDAIEWAAAEVEGIQAGGAIAFSRPGGQTEQLIVAAETRERDPVRLERLRASVVGHLRAQGSFGPIEVVLMPPGALPKTSSGKVQRSRARAQYLEGTLGGGGSRRAGSRSWLGIASHVGRSALARVRSGLGRRS